MKFLTIALMTTKKGLGVFHLPDVITRSYDQLKQQLNEDGYVFYQIILMDTLEKSYKFLQMLHIENEAGELEQESLDEAELNHVVLALPDDYHRALPLAAFARQIFVLYPGSHINQELNDALMQNELRLKALNLEVHRILEDCLASPAEKDQLQEKLQAAVERQAELEQSWRQYALRPFQELKGPQYEVGDAPTPIMSDQEDESPVLQRQHANAHLGLFDRRNERVALEVMLGDGNRQKNDVSLEDVSIDNNNNEDRPVAYRKN